MLIDNIFSDKKSQTRAAGYLLFTFESHKLAKNSLNFIRRETFAFIPDLKSYIHFFLLIAESYFSTIASIF